MKTLILAAIRCSLMFTAVAALSVAYPAKANLITNGGFETGDFTGWAVNIQTEGGVDGTNPHSGNFAAFFLTGSLQQSVATTPGASYTINFFLAFTGFSLHNSFSVSWDGVNIFSLTNESHFDYEEVTFYRDRLGRLHGTAVPIQFIFPHRILVPRRRQRYPHWGERPRYRLYSFSARIRFARLGCLAAQIGLLSLEKALPKGQAIVIVG